MTFVKICGLRTVEHALAAVEAGADMIGLVFAPSRRQVTPEQAALLIQQVRAAYPNHPVSYVGLFVNEAPERIAAIAKICRLDALQLSGDEHASILDQLPGLTIIKALRLTGGDAEESWLGLPGTSDLRLLMDAHVPGSYGGTGVVADWRQAAMLARRQPIMLAGGLTPENVTMAIQQVRPWAVDVSSGVEVDGVKDSARMRAFVVAARQADHALGSGVA